MSEQFTYALMIISGIGAWLLTDNALIGLSFAAGFIFAVTVRAVFDLFGWRL